MIFITCLLFILIFYYFYWRFYGFFRDPERLPPGGNNIVSPADGTVVYVRQVQDGEVPLSIKGKKKIFLNEIFKNKIREGNYWIIGIFMHPTSVHVNRSPISGRVQDTVKIPAKNKPMTLMWWRAVLNMRPFERYGGHITENERVTTTIEGDLRVVITQIADVYVSRIENTIKTGDILKKGQRIGRIVFGSQVDILLPTKDLKVAAVEGQKVIAGETVLAKY